MFPRATNLVIISPALNDFEWKDYRCFPDLWGLRRLYTRGSTESSPSKVDLSRLRGMFVNPVVANVLGTIGTLLWCIQIIPQIWKSWREKSTAGLSQFLVLLWGLAGIPLGVYALLQNLAIPLIVQPHMFSFLALVAWAQCLYYDKGFPAWKAVLTASIVMVSEGGLEVGMYFAVRPSMNQQAIQFFGVLTSVLIALGLLPQYWEIYKHKEVVGLSVPFITVDFLGGVFSLLSLLFRPEFDTLAGVAYSLVIVMDGLVVMAAIVLNPLARRRRRKEAMERGDVTPARPGMTESRTMTQNSATSSIDYKLAKDPEMGLATIEEPNRCPAELKATKDSGIDTSQ